MNPSDIDVGVGTGEGIGEEENATSGAVANVICVFTIFITLATGLIFCPV